jgi:hypothetical protein
MLEEILRVKAELSEAIQNKEASKANNLYADNCVMFLLAPPMPPKTWTRVRVVMTSSTRPKALASLVGPTLSGTTSPTRITTMKRIRFMGTLM